MLIYPLLYGVCLVYLHSVQGSDFFSRYTLSKKSKADELYAVPIQYVPRLRESVTRKAAENLIAYELLFYCHKVKRICENHFHTKTLEAENVSLCC